MNNSKLNAPLVHVGIVQSIALRVFLKGEYTCGTTTVSGLQTIGFHNGKAEWKGNTYVELDFKPLSPDASFALEEVTIGIGFHWERKETQVFKGQLRIIIDNGKLQAINILPVEEYLKSVISSEMSASASLQLLKAHAVISRGWLLAQINKRKEKTASRTTSYYRSDKGIIRWYDREDHTLFDVCADDHCQRYQGITRQTSTNVNQAVDETCGQVLTYKGQICDTRFSKCCGGIMEEFSTCWEDIDLPYLKALPDTPDTSHPIPDLTIEENARRWIMDTQHPTINAQRPIPMVNGQCSMVNGQWSMVNGQCSMVNDKRPMLNGQWSMVNGQSAFCNTHDKRILAQVLNNYDQETTDFYRWQVTYTQEELTQIVSDRLGIDLGPIIALHPLRRGKSGRIIELEIVGEKRTYTIGKELEIRRSLSRSHLLSSAFVVDYEYAADSQIPQTFILHGAGWGHGVGLCQIGAAVMGESGYDYKDILLHYYPETELIKQYSHIANS